MSTRAQPHLSDVPPRDLFLQLARWMIGCGLLAGLLFPLLALQLGVAPALALSPAFFTVTLLAGLVVGAANFQLARWVIRPRLRHLAGQMHQVAEDLSGAAYSADWSGCSPEACRVQVESVDDLGECAHAFNRLIDALLRTHEVEDAVSSFSGALATQLELKPLAESALSLIHQYTGASAGAVLVVQEGRVLPAARFGLRETEKLGENELVAVALRTLAPQRIELPESVQIDALVAEIRPAELLLLPVEYKGLALGVIVLAATVAFAADTRRLLELFRASFGLALNNAITHQRLQQIAALDPLTGLYNRRFGLGRLREEIKRAQRDRAPLGVVLFDIDHFKRVNDTYGHLVGDRVLSAVAQSSRRVLREGDVLLRYGGEEFIMVLPGASRENCRLIAERLRHAVADTRVQDGDQEIRVTLSAGVTAFPEVAAEEPADLIQEADRALYAAKSGGRDRVEVR